MIELVDLIDSGGDLRNVRDLKPEAVQKRVIITQRIKQHLVVRHALFQILKRLFLGIERDAGDVINLFQFGLEFR